MKTKSLPLIMLSAIMIACNENKQAFTDLIVVDVEANYPQKELILQDFAEVEYIPLESSDEFITKGFIEDIGQKIVLATNRDSSGDIFIFDRQTGKGIKKINRKGQGGEEYVQMNKAILDEENNEIFVIDYTARKVQVYDLQGNHKRGFKFADESFYHYTYNYDRKHLLTFKGYTPGIVEEQACHILISKQDGSVVRRFQRSYIPAETPVYTGMHEKYGEITMVPSFHLTTPSLDGWCLTQTSCDTIYNYSGEDVRPFIVRTPSIHAMETKVFLYPTAITDRYCFMYTQTKKVNLQTFGGFPSTELVYDRQENAVFKSKVYNDDFTEKKSVSFITDPMNQEDLICQALEAADLAEAYKEGTLKGKLKEIAATLHEEDNPVVMVVKKKKH